MENCHREDEVVSSFASVDPQWDSDYFSIMSANSTKGKCAVQIFEKFGNYIVNATGDYTKKNAIFRVYQGIDNIGRIVVMFECISEQPHGWMLAVDDNGKLTTRKRKVEYKNFSQGEPDVVFIYHRVDYKHGNVMFYSEKAKGFVGFDTNGDPMSLEEVPKYSKAADLYLEQSKLPSS